MPATRLRVARTEDGLAVSTAGLDVLEVLADGRPSGPAVAVADGELLLPLPAEAGVLEVRGYAGDELRQLRRLWTDRL